MKEDHIGMNNEVDQFVHMHRHSEYSPLDGLGTADQWALEAKELGQPGLNITDHGTMAGVLHHIKACRAQNITPLVGMEAYYKPDRHLKDDEHRKAYHLTLVANSLAGWHNLIELSTEAYRSGFYYYPCIDDELMRQYNDGITVLTGCVSSYLNQSILRGDDKSANKFMDHLQGTYGDNVWMEFMPHDFDDCRTYNLELVGIGQERGIRGIATLDAHFPYADWSSTQMVLEMMRTKQSFKKREKAKEDGNDLYGGEIPTLYLMKRQEVEQTFAKYHPDLPEDFVQEICDNTLALTAETKFYVINRDYKLPKVSDSPAESEKILRGWIHQGFTELVELWREDGLDEDEIMDRKVKYNDRLEYELRVLRDNGVLDYFVIVGDLVRWCHKEGVRMGLGRGSAAGSLVSFLIGITAIDPIQYGLLFERFLNPDRKGLPDIDLDFDSRKRDDVKQYLRDKYGDDKVMEVCSFQTFGPKGVIKDVSAVFDLWHEPIDKINKTITDKDSDLDKMAKDNEMLAGFKERNPVAWKHIVRLEGQVERISKHAAATIVTPEPVTNYMPLVFNKDHDLVTGWDDNAEMPIVSDFGFLKLDLLGIQSLTQQEIAVEMIEQNHGVKLDLNKLRILRDPHYKDQKVHDVFNKGQTLGVFQFAGDGITNLIRHIKIDSIIDLGIANALYRPGPIKFAFEYGDRKEQGDSDEFYWHPSVKPLLQDTLGIMAFQEQLMIIVRELGGFTPSQADDMRKAVSKFYRLPGDQAQQFMQGYYDQWLKGCTEKGLDKDAADAIWEQILPFGDYSFNKSHSMSYSGQAWQDAYIKAYYPPEEYASILSKNPKVAKEAAREARQFGVELTTPNINKSGLFFTLEDGKIMFGLGAVDHVGDTIVSDIIKGRPYTSFEDFIVRKASNIGAAKSLIAAGAFDDIDDKAYLLSTMEKPGKGKKCDECDGAGCEDCKQVGYTPITWTVADFIQHNTKLKKPRPIPEDRLEPSKKDLDEAEKQALGVSFSSQDVLDKNRELIEERIWTEEEVNAENDGTNLVVGGEVISYKEIKTKKGDKMAFAKVGFYDNQYEITIFPKQYKEYRALLDSAIAIMVHGKFDAGRKVIVADTIMDVEDLEGVVNADDENN